MRSRVLKVLTAASAGIFLAAVPVMAHHWFPVAGTDPPIAFSGKVTRVQWVNPHVHITVDIKAGPNIDPEAMRKRSEYPI